MSDSRSTAHNTETIARPPTRDELAEIRALLMTDANMERFLDKLFGSSRWTYDMEQDVWIVTDSVHVGPGRGYIVMRRGGDWSTLRSRD